MHELMRGNPGGMLASGKGSAACIIRRFSALTKRSQLVGLEHPAETNFRFRCYRNPDITGCTHLFGGEAALGADLVRDYYCVEDSDGGRFWLFRTGRNAGAVGTRWFLHGLFG
jgi:hypothetical protein